MATRKVTSKNEFAKIASNLTIQEQGAGYEKYAPVYEYREGSFRCSIHTDGTTLEEQKELLRHRASCLDRYSIITPAELNRRSNRLQQALAFIGAHRELIPLLMYAHLLTSGGRKISFNKIVDLYIRTATLPEIVYLDRGNYEIAGVKFLSKSGVYNVWELIAQVPYLPKAWRA